ncbi:diguanylate cyclase domain-containing protein [Cupriavidus basilensis]
MEMMSGAVTEAVSSTGHGRHRSPRCCSWISIISREVNDAFGHTVGDAVLREVAARLRRFTTPSTFSARVGGDEIHLGAARR